MSGQARPSAFPLCIRYGRYTAHFMGADKERFEGDPIVSATWEIRRGQELLGRMFDGPAYGWKRPHASLDPVRWIYLPPAGVGYPRDPNAVNWHDLGPLPETDRDPYFVLLKAFAKRCDYIRKNGINLMVSSFYQLTAR